MNQLSVAELAHWLAQSDRAGPQVVDVREPWEIATASLPGTTNVPMRDVPGRLADLDAGREIVVMCHHGGRSMQVAMFLEHHGFKVHNLAGGIDAWSREIDAGVPRY